MKIEKIRTVRSSFIGDDPAEVVTLGIKATLNDEHEQRSVDWMAEPFYFGANRGEGGLAGHKAFEKMIDYIVARCGEEDKCSAFPVRLDHIQTIIDLSQKSKSELLKLNRELERAYHNSDMSKAQLIYQITFLRDAPEE